MRLKRIPTALALVLTGLVAFAPRATADATKTLTLEMDARGKVAVENLAGTMTIIPGRGSKVVATATIHAGDSTLLQTIRLEQVKNKDGLPTIRVIYPIDDYATFRYNPSTGGGWVSRMFGGNSNTRTKYAGERVRVSSNHGVELYADVEVQVPRGSEVDFRNVVGKVHAEGVDGDFEFDTGSGEITLENLSGRISADTGSGDIVAERISGEFSGDTGSGDIHLRDFDGESISCDTGSGDIYVEGAVVREIDADTGSGEIQIENSEIERFTGDTGSGDIYLEVDGSRLVSVSADTGSGDVTLVLGPDASFDARADLASGDIVSRYKDAEAIYHRRELIGFRRGSGRTTISVDTGSGDLVLKPGT